MALVYVALIDEGTPVWQPVSARHVRGDVYELQGTRPPGEEWQFQPGQLVQCEQRAFGDGETGLVALSPVTA